MPQTLEDRVVEFGNTPVVLTHFLELSLEIGDPRAQFLRHIDVATGADLVGIESLQLSVGGGCDEHRKFTQ